MTIADAAILAAHKACEEKTSLEIIVPQEATRQKNGKLLTSNFEKEQKIEETTEAQEISGEKKNRVFPGNYSCYHFDCLHHRWHILVFAIR